MRQDTKVAKVTRFFATFPGITTCKKLHSLTSSSNKQCGVSLWLLQVEIFLLREQASEKLTRHSNKITSSSCDSTALFGASLSLIRQHIQYSWWLCSPFDSRNEVWFITEDVNIIDQTQGGVSSPLFGLAGYVSFAEQGVPVFKNLAFKQGIQLYNLESSTGCLFGTEALIEKSMKCGMEQSKWAIPTIAFRKNLIPWY